MSSKLIGAIVAVLALGALLMWQFNAEEAADRQGTEVKIELPKIDKTVVDGLEITTPDKGSVTLEKKGDKWALTAPIQFAAAQAAVDAALDKLDELEVSGVAATKEKNHERLEVTDDKAVKLVVKQDDKVLLDLRIGAYRTGNTMVRLAGQTPVATIKGSIRYAFSKTVKEWRDRTITDFELTSVEKMTIENDKGIVTIVKDGADAYMQAPGDPPIKDFNKVKAKSIIGSATHLNAVDFIDSPNLETLGLGATPKSKVTLDIAGKPAVVLIGTKVDNYWHAKLADSPLVYTVSNFMGERLSSGPDDFIEEEEKPIDAAKLEAAGAQMMQPDGTSGLPPGVMEQVKAQLAAQGAQGVQLKQAQ